MKTVNTFGVHFTLRQTKKQEGQLPIYVRIVVNGNRSEVSLKYKVTKEDWNTAKGAAKPKNDLLRQLNNHLEETRTKIANHYHALSRQGGDLTAAAVKDAYLGIVKEKTEDKNYTLLWLAEEHNVHMQKVLKPGSLKNYYTTTKYLKVFLGKKYSSKDIFLKELKFEFITALEYFIRNHPIKDSDPCTNNGTMKHLERLKKMINWAVRNEWIEKNPFNNYKLKYKHKERDFLNAEELCILEKADLGTIMLRQVNDLFVFSCYTGLAYIDLVNLAPNQIVAGSNSTRWIRTSRAKNDIGVNVPLLKPAIDIMEKFKSGNDAAIRETIFPRISNQEMNRSLKIIAGICGIQKYLTFHLARHTFATTVTLMNGVPIESISKMLGHSKLSTTMIYARVTQFKVGLDMEMLENKSANKKT